MSKTTVGPGSTGAVLQSQFLCVSSPLGTAGRIPTRCEDGGRAVQASDVGREGPAGPNPGTSATRGTVHEWRGQAGKAALQRRARVAEQPLGEVDTGRSIRGERFVRRSECPVCGRPGSPFLSLPYDADPVAGYLARHYGGALDTALLTGERYELTDCACGLVYQARVPHDELLEHIYGHAALHDPEKENRVRGLDVRRRYANDIEQCIKFFGSEPSSVEVLDFGSGPGLWLDMAKGYGCVTAGSEMIDSGLERLRASGHEAIPPAELPTGRFHFVNMEQVVEHLVDPRGTVQQLVSSLRPGGILRICVPNGTGIRRRLEVGDWEAPKGSPTSLDPVAPLEHVNCFDHGSLRLLGRAVGLEPFHFPLRQHLDQMERIRFAASAVLHVLHRPRGTLQWFRKPSS